MQPASGHAQIFIWLTTGRGTRCDNSDQAQDDTTGRKAGQRVPGHLPPSPLVPGPIIPIALVNNTPAKNAPVKNSLDKNAPNDNAPITMKGSQGRFPPVV